MELHRIGLHNYCMLITSIANPIWASPCPINNTGAVHGDAAGSLQTLTEASCFAPLKRDRMLLPLFNLRRASLPRRIVHELTC
ncbi:hypothetical protein EDB80DRAFT_706223 [Ilyonectria destructans]|nr:hypothetical protein EDB80DRAFT_706223 [Ilyonectria destructans]